MKKILTLATAIVLCVGVAHAGKDKGKKKEKTHKTCSGKECGKKKG